MQPDQCTYGSDKNGLVWGYLFEPGVPAIQIISDTAAEWIAAKVKKPENAFLWLHFSLSNVSSEPWIRRHLALPDAFYESFHEGVGSTRLEQEDDSLVATIHDVLFDFSFDVSAVSTVSLCILPYILVSARRKPLRSVDHLRASVKSGQLFRSSAELLAHLLTDQANVLVGIIRQSTIRIDAIEDKLLDNRISVSRSELGSLRRVLVRLQRLLAPEPAAFFRLLNKPPRWISGEDLQVLREAAEEFSSAVVDSGALTERIKLLQEEIAASISEQTSRTLYILTVVTVMAIPINLAAGLFGMNVAGIPLSTYKHGFIVIVGILAVLTALIAYLAFGKHQE
jgi:zinc transporter